MPLLKNNAFIADNWAVLADDAAVTQAGHQIIPLARLKSENLAVADLATPVGIALSNTDEIEDVQDLLAHVQLISLPFPAFADGRAYSIGRQIRQAGFKGELRATGNILPDQFQMMNEVGFSSFVVSDRYPLQTWQAAARQMSLVYQRGLYRRAGETDILAQRHDEALEEDKNHG